MSWRVGLSCAVLVLGCAHAKQIETPAEAKPAPAPQPVAEHHVAAPPPGHPALSDSPSGTFEPGAVREIQRALRNKGFSAPETGRLDEATQRQVARYQKQQDLPDTGYPDDATLKKLGLDPGKLHRTHP
jgi:peptidoglycan hydrolase-like protein with peptidoglycan-binding domain